MSIQRRATIQQRWTAVMLMRKVLMLWLMKLMEGCLGNILSRLLIMKAHTHIFNEQLMNSTLINFVVLYLHNNNFYNHVFFSSLV